MSFGKNLKSLRLKHHLTQEELSKNTGINRSNLGMYEQDRTFPQFDKLQILANYFHVDMNTLLADGSAPAFLSASQSGEVARSAGGVSLNPEEIRLLDRLRRLTPAGRAKIASYTDYILMEEEAVREENIKKAGTASA